jgi:hypothetical protein
MDFMMGLGQVICIIGLLYGAWLSITYGARDEVEQASRAAPHVDLRKPGEPGTAFDALTGHAWRANPPLG